MRILLVEDDPEQLEPLQAALVQSGHSVDAIADSDTALWLLGDRDYDLLILDWMLPGCSGLDLCRHYRQQGKTAPVLMLTAKDTTVDVVAGLDAGADDYLVKPTDLIELLARVRALGRRLPQWQADILEQAGLRLDRTRMQVMRAGVTVDLSSREFQLLEYLMRHPQQVMSRNQLEATLWEFGEEPESNAVTVLVRRLRQRLRPLGAADCIETVYGSGYRFQPRACQEEP